MQSNPNEIFIQMPLLYKCQSHSVTTLIQMFLFLNFPYYIGLQVQIFSMPITSSGAIVFPYNLIRQFPPVVIIYQEP